MLQILDRANWCPGTRAQTFDHEISNYITISDSVEINIDFQFAFFELIAKQYQKVL